MEKEISLRDLLETTFTINGNGEMVGEFTLKRINMIVDILTQQYKEIERLNYKIKRIAYQCYKSDMSYEEFKQIWVNAMGKIYEPSQIDELEKELGVDKE